MARKKSPKADKTTSDEPVADKATEAETGSATDPSFADTHNDAEEPAKQTTGTEGEDKAVDATPVKDASPEKSEDPAPEESEDTPEDSAKEEPAEADPVEVEPAEEEPVEAAAETGAASVEAQPDAADDAKDATEPNAASEPEPEIERQTVETQSATPAPAKVEQVVVRKGGFVPMLFGGLVAGGVGFAAAYYGIAQQPDQDAELAPRIDELSSEISLQEQTIDGLATRLDALPAAPDLAPIDSQIAEIAAQAADLDAAISTSQAEVSALSERLSSISDQVEDIDGRVTQLEQQPVTDNASDAAVAAYERELQAAQDQIAQQVQEAREQIAQEMQQARDALAQQLETMQARSDELEAMIAEAQSTEAEAEEAAKAATQRAAVSRIAAAVEAGSPFPGALDELQGTGVEAPAALTEVAENGPPSATSLQESFPDLARNALSASREAAADSGEVGGFSDFLRSQLGARSLEPQEGNDPDAVLSRAEAAVRAGKFAEAIAELDSLPEAGKAVVTDWVATANRRLNALNAVQELSENLN